MNGNIASFINFSKTRKGLSQNSPEIEQSYREYIADTNIPQSTITEAEKEVISENMMGIDFAAMSCNTLSVIRIVQNMEDFGKNEMEFKKGEW